MNKNLFFDITPSQKNYLRAIYNLSNGTDKFTIKSIDVSDYLDVSPASVSRAMKLLQKAGFIVRPPENGIKLTVEGLRIVNDILNRYMIIKIFLTKILKIDEETAEIDAWNMEHVVSGETIFRIEQYGSKEVLENRLSFTYT